MITKNDIEIYLEVKEKLTKLCKKWAKDNLEDWQHYSGFEITDDGDISIGYTYSDYEYHTEFDSIKITLEDLLTWT